MTMCRSLIDLLGRIHADQQRAKKDPFHPVSRSKGEKARNRKHRT